MPDSIILLDFGASRIKAVLWSLAESRSLASHECPSPVLRRGAGGEAVGEPEEYWQALQATAGQLAHLDHAVANLWLCSEMHGFMLADPLSAKPLTPYISWQDQRACHPLGDGTSPFQDLQHTLAPLLLREAGMRIRPGLPIVNLASMVHELKHASPSRFLTLVDWLLIRGGESKPRCHPTLAAGTGLYSLTTQNWSDALLSHAGLASINLALPSVNHDASSPLGTIQLNGRALRVWGGVGDLQAAAHGMGFPKKAPVLVNLGTGSQVMVAAASRKNDVEVRLCAENQLAHAITHIPSGRALNTFAAFLDDCARAGGGEAFFWRNFSALQADKVLDADACVDLNTFSASWRYEDGGKIVRIADGAFSAETFMASLAKSWLTQYAQALSFMPLPSACSSFLLGGGLSRRAPFIPRVLESMLAMTSRPVELRTGEETLDGLLSLAEANP